MRKSLFTPALFLSASFLAPAAMPVVAWAQPMIQSQEGIALQNEIEQLQSQVQQLQSGARIAATLHWVAVQAPPPAPSSGDNTPVAGGVVSGLLTQVQRLQSQVQAFNGEVDALRTRVTAERGDAKQTGDLNFKVTGYAPPGTTPPALRGAAPTPRQALTPVSGRRLARWPSPGQPRTFGGAARGSGSAAAPVPGDPEGSCHRTGRLSAGSIPTSAAMATALVKSDRAGARKLIGRNLYHGAIRMPHPGEPGCRHCLRRCVQHKSHQH